MGFNCAQLKIAKHNCNIFFDGKYWFNHFAFKFKWHFIRIRKRKQDYYEFVRFIDIDYRFKVLR